MNEEIQTKGIKTFLKEYGEHSEMEDFILQKKILKLKNKLKNRASIYVNISAIAPLLDRNTSFIRKCSAIEGIIKSNSGLDNYIAQSTSQTGIPRNDEIKNPILKKAIDDLAEEETNEPMAKRVSQLIKKAKSRQNEEESDPFGPISDESVICMEGAKEFIFQEARKKRGTNKESLLSGFVEQEYGQKLIKTNKMGYINAYKNNTKLTIGGRCDGWTEDKSILFEGKYRANSKNNGYIPYSTLVQTQLYLKAFCIDCGCIVHYDCEGNFSSKNITHNEFKIRSVIKKIWDLLM